jgi:hypothetical protein
MRNFREFLLMRSSQNSPSTSFVKKGKKGMEFPLLQTSR